MNPYSVCTGTVFFEPKGTVLADTGGSGIPANAITLDDGVTAITLDDGVTIITTDI